MKPILFESPLNPFWLYLIVPIPHNDLYSIYRRRKNLGVAEPKAWEKACEHLYPKKEAIDTINGWLICAEEIDRLTALLRYGLVVQER